MGAEGRLELVPELECCKGLDLSSSPASEQTASPTVPHPSLLCPQVLQDCQRYRSNIRETGDLWVSGAECSFVPPRRWLLRNMVGTERVKHCLKQPAVSLADGCVPGGATGSVGSAGSG